MSKSTQNQDLKGHRAVVTGASSGIGEQYARQLAERGADLVLAARRIDRLEKLARELSEKYGVRAEAMRIDLAQAGSARKLFEAATAGDRPVTLLVNNAGIGPYGRFLKGPLDKHTATIQLNTVALTELCHLFSAHMIGHGKRSYISNVASIAAFQGSPNFAVYAGTKVYVRVFSEILARELKGTPVTVTCVCPGGTYTEFLETNGQVLREQARGAMMSAEDVVRIGLKGTLSGSLVVIPGLLNKIACYAPKFLPSGLALTFAEMAMKRSVDEKDASSG